MARKSLLNISLSIAFYLLVVHPDEKCCNWIIRAIERALNLYRDAELDIAIVSYSSSNIQIQNLIQKYR